jgi:hypothetical protein
VVGKIQYEYQICALWTVNDVTVKDPFKRSLPRWGFTTSVCMKLLYRPKESLPVTSLTVHSVLYKIPACIIGRGELWWNKCSIGLQRGFARRESFAAIICHNDELSLCLT